MKRLFVSSFSLLLCSLLFLYTAKAQVLQYTSQSLHAHNDYKQAFPFWEAYQQGYGSIEVDIFLHNNQLLVAHEEAELDTAKTLEKLYLQPLLQCIRKEQHKRNLILLIDLKTDAETTLQALIALLQHYTEIIKNKNLQLLSFYSYHLQRYILMMCMSCMTLEIHNHKGSQNLLNLLQSLIKTFHTLVCFFQS